MQCPQCQHENREGRRFCAECGAPLALKCSTCAFENEPDDRFCGGCGASLTSQAQPRPVAEFPPASEPKRDAAFTSTGNGVSKAAR